jgi:hypothetical protein
MRLGRLLSHLALLAFLLYLFIFLLTGYHPENPAFRPPFLLFVLDTINLYIHEAGHFFFQFFGRWIHVIAGSLFQILLPLALWIVVFRQNREYSAFPGFWVGESMVNVSVYIQDAPHKQLRLIARGLIHDWNWLLRDNLELAEPIGEAVYIIGLFCCAVSIVAGLYFAVVVYRTAPADPLPE